MTLKTAWANLQDGLGNRFSWSHVKAIYYNFSQNKLLSEKLDEIDLSINDTDFKIGDLNDLETSDKTNIVSSINEVNEDTNSLELKVGEISNLDTSSKSDLVSSINEVNDVALTSIEQLGDLYNPEATYSAGDYCIYNNVLYKCNTAIETAEAWTADHWDATTVAAEIGELNQNIGNLIKTTTVNTTVSLTAGTHTGWTVNYTTPEGYSRLTFYFIYNNSAGVNMWAESFDASKLSGFATCFSGSATVTIRATIIFIKIH